MLYSLDLRSWIELVFPGRQIRKVFFPGVLNKTEGSIIPNPKYDMDIPLMNYNLSKDINTIYEELSAPPSPTTKKVFATVRGQGGGKSRILEEIRRKLLDDDTLLPIAITCNAFSGVGSFEDDWLEKSGLQYGILYTISIISRMVFALYEFDNFETIISKITKIFSISLK